MLLEKIKGRNVHFYQIDGCEFYVIRDKQFGAALCRDEKSTAVAVLIPPGMSYKQGAMRAAAALKRREFVHVEHPL